MLSTRACNVVVTLAVLLGLIFSPGASLAASPKLKQVAMIDLPGAPGFNGMALVGGLLLITHPGAGTLDVFDTAKRRVVQQVSGLEDLQGIAVDARAGKVYVANAKGKSIVVISTADWKVAQTIPLDMAPLHLALSPDGALLFVANGLGQPVSEVDLAHGNRVRSVPLGGAPRGLAYDAERHLLYVSLQDTAEVVAVDSGMNVVSRFKLVASQPTGLVLDAAARRLYVAIRYAVVALQVDDGKEVVRVAAPPGADSVWLDAASGTLFVGSGGGYVSMMTAKGSSFVPLDELHSGVRGSAIAYEAERGLLYMPGGRDGKSKLLIVKRVQTGQ